MSTNVRLVEVFAVVDGSHPRPLITEDIYYVKARRENKTRPGGTELILSTIGAPNCEMAKSLVAAFNPTWEVLEAV